MQQWVQTWGQAHTALSAFSFASGCRTLRLVLKSNIGGTAIRVRLSNEFGRDAVILGGVCAALCDEEGVLTSDSVDLDAPAFLPAGESAVTSEGALRVPVGSYLCVSVCVNGGPLQSGNLMNNARCLMMHGDRRHSIFPDDLGRFKDMLRGAASTLLRMKLPAPIPLFDTVELLNADGASSIVVFGDSLSQQGFWVNPFEERIRDVFPGRFSVINRSIGGNRVLRDTSPVFPLKGFYGVRSLNRLRRDVLQYPDISHAVLEVGVNDVLQFGTVSGRSNEKPDIDILTQGIFSMAAEMRANGIRVMGTTLPYIIDHIDGTKEKSDLVDQVNETLRTNAEAFDALLDLGAIVADPDKPQHAKREYLGGDKLHFNEKGGDAVANAVDLGFFEQA